MNDDILLDSAARATLDDYYDAFLPDGSRRVLENVARALDSEAAAHDRRLRLTRLTLLAAAAAIVALVVIAPLWFRGSTPPAATASASASASVRPSAAATVPPAPTVSLPAPIVYPAPDATLNPDATVAAQVERVGQIRTGGLWAIQRGVSDAWLLLSFDGGGSWSRQRIELSDEIADSVFVLDADHAWSIVTAPGTAAPMYRTHAPTAVDPPRATSGSSSTGRRTAAGRGRRRTYWRGITRTGR